MTGLCKLRKHPISEGTLDSSCFIRLANWPQRQCGEIMSVSFKRTNVMRNQPLVNQLVRHCQTLSPILFDSVTVISIDLGLNGCSCWQTIRNLKKELFPRLPFCSSRLTELAEESLDQELGNQHSHTNTFKTSAFTQTWKDCRCIWWSMWCFEKGAIGITCLPLFNTIFTILIPAMK